MRSSKAVDNARKIAWRVPTNAADVLVIGENEDFFHRPHDDGFSVGR